VVSLTLEGLDDRLQRVERRLESWTKHHHELADRLMRFTGPGKMATKEELHDAVLYCSHCDFRIRLGLDHNDGASAHRLSIWGQDFFVYLRGAES
jgi:hypothetical protein